MTTEIESRFIGRAAPGSSRAGAGGWPCQGIYYTGRGQRPRVALIASHYSVDFSQHYLAERIASRGIGFLGWNTRFRGSDAFFVLDQALIDIHEGVRWLREEMGVEVLLLLGNSGGASLMAAYHSQAVEPSIAPAPGMRPAPGIDQLSPADGFVSLAAHPGRPDVLTAWMDPSVTDETDPVSIDPDLSLWNPENGPPYSPEFLAKYRQAQEARNRRITRWAESELTRLAEHGARDRQFTVYRTWADPRMVDPTIEPSNRRPNHCYQGDPRRANFSAWGIGATSTLRSWLSMWSLDRSQCRAEPHLRRVAVPTLVLHADADTGVYRSDADAIFDAVAAADKELVELPGDHYFTEPEGAADQVADRIAAWISAHWRVP